jgi:ABC-type transport system involved in multi-copper enzyme maturation permease subunit
MADSNTSRAAQNLQIMRALLAKDLRLCRPIMLGLIASGAGCYLIAVISVLSENSFPHKSTLHTMLESLSAAAVFSCQLANLLASAFGGVAIAGERTDRTADFLAMLPITRRQIILSKMTVSLGVLGMCAIFHLLIFFSARILADHISGAYLWSDLSSFPACLACSIACAISFFGVAFLLSTFLRSGPISACVSIGATIASYGIVGSSMDGHHYSDWGAMLRLGSLPLALGLSSLTAGTLYYLRRVAP